MAEIDKGIEARAGVIDSARDRFKITVSGLCGRCQHSHIWRTARMNEPVVICRSLEAGNQRVPTDVVECNHFAQIGELSVWELAQLCLDIDISKPTKKVGFHGE